MFTSESIIGKSTHNEFQWKWAYGARTSSIKISYTGTSLEITGKTIASGTGSHTHRL